MAAGSRFVDEEVNNWDRLAVEETEVNVGHGRIPVASQKKGVAR